jgi:hypothetical protein
MGHHFFFFGYAAGSSFSRKAFSIDWDPPTGCLFTCKKRLHTSVIAMTRISNVVSHLRVFV